MDDEHVARSIAALEEALVLGDPDLNPRLARLERAESIVVRVAFGFLASGSILFVTGLAAQSPLLAAAGLALFILSVSSDPAFKRYLRRRP